jgi:hypothetical protein
VALANTSISVAGYLGISNGKCNKNIDLTKGNLFLGGRRDKRLICWGELVRMVWAGLEYGKSQRNYPWVGR